IKDFEQSEISIAYPALTVGDERTAVLSSLDYILGTGMGSRLFRRLREKMGLVYSIYSQPWYGRDNGVFSICANVNVTNVEKSVVAIKEEIDKLLKDGVTQSETDKAKTQLKVNAMFGKENPMNYMLALMRRRILLDEDYDLDALIAKIDRVTPSDVNALAHEILEQKTAIAYAGKKPPKAIDKLFYKA
ncbi:MAG: insulinase family protein, partial [Clostridiales bacterium]|nr:insulinase family protein [Clostridiales bacterium]